MKIKTRKIGKKENSLLQGDGELMLAILFSFGQLIKIFHQKGLHFVRVTDIYI